MHTHSPMQYFNKSRINKSFQIGTLKIIMRQAMKSYSIFRTAKNACPLINCHHVAVTMKHNEAHSVNTY